MWETIRALLTKGSLPLILLGLTMALVGAMGSVSIGSAQFSIPELGFRVSIVVIGVVILLFALFLDVSSQWQSKREEFVFHQAVRTVLETQIQELRTLSVAVGQLIANGAAQDPSATDIIGSAIATINEKLELAVKSIIAEVRRQQRAFSRVIQDKFDEQAVEAAKTLETALRRELDRVTSAPTRQDRDHLAARFSDLVIHAIHQMGQFQKVNIERQGAESILSVESQVSSAILEVANEVRELKTRIDILQTPSLTSGQPPIEEPVSSP